MDGHVNGHVDGHVDGCANGHVDRNVCRHVMDMWMVDVLTASHPWQPVESVSFSWIINNLLFSAINGLCAYNTCVRASALHYSTHHRNRSCPIPSRPSVYIRACVCACVHVRVCACTHMHTQARLQCAHACVHAGGRAGVCCVRRHTHPRSKPAEGVGTLDAGPSSARSCDQICPHMLVAMHTIVLWV